MRKPCKSLHSIHTPGWSTIACISIFFFSFLYFSASGSSFFTSAPSLCPLIAKLKIFYFYVFFKWLNLIILVFDALVNIRLTKKCFFFIYFTFSSNFLTNVYEFFFNPEFFRWSFLFPFLLIMKWHSVKTGKNVECMVAKTNPGIWRSVKRSKFRNCACNAFYPLFIAV